MIRGTLILISLILGVLTGVAQTESPIINKDNSVTFNYYNPRAEQVAVRGSVVPKKAIIGPFGKTGKLKMSRKGDIWTCTTEPLASELYTYQFEIDGEKNIKDPLNKNVIRDIADTLSYFIIPEGVADDYKTQNVRHGQVKKVWYPSSLNGMKKRRMSVYLPAAYSSNPNSRFPVLYLLHGSGGDEDAWLDSGRAVQILDNLIAEGRCEPMIVVMPNGNVDLAATPGYDPENPDVMPSAKNTNSMLGMFEDSFMKEIVGYVDKHYRTKAEKPYRAIAGLSLGGLHTKYISLNNPESFDYIGLFSAQTSNMIDKNVSSIKSIGEAWNSLKNNLPFIGGGKIDKAISKYTSDALYVYDNEDAKLKTLFAEPPKLYYIAVGKDDFVKKLNDDYRKKLTGNDYAFTYNETDGGHTWENWRKYLVDFLPRLFR